MTPTGASTRGFRSSRRLNSSEQDRMSLNNVTHGVSRRAARAHLLRETAEVEELPGRQGSSHRFQETPTKTGVFRVNLAAPAIWRFRILSLAFVYSRLLSSCASAMTLTITLAAEDLPSLLAWDLPERPPKMSAKAVKLDRHRSTLQRSVGIRYRVQSTSICANRMWGVL
jgi:hypothetical protein